MSQRAHERVDGNAAGGALMEVFGVDMTGARGTCRRCARVAVLAETVAEIDDQGVILLCRGCGHTLLTYVRVGSGRVVAFSGLEELRWEVVDR